MKLFTARNLARATATGLTSRHPVESFSRSLGWSMFWKIIRSLFR